MPCNIPAMPGGIIPAIPGGIIPAIPGGIIPAIPGGIIPAIPGGIIPAIPGGIIPAGMPTLPGMPTGDIPAPIPGTIDIAGAPPYSIAGAGAFALGSLRDLRFGIDSPNFLSNCFLLAISGTVSSPVAASFRLTRIRPRASASLE
eukprot:scaffold2107_cov127-Isochrysis_galbana.AAC.3